MILNAYIVINVVVGQIGQGRDMVNVRWAGLEVTGAGSGYYGREFRVDSLGDLGVARVGMEVMGTGVGSGYYGRERGVDRTGYNVRNGGEWSRYWEKR